MGIIVEFNPDLALRNISEYKKGNRKLEECIPEKIEAGKIYSFLKKGARNYWLFGELPLVETKGNQELSKPKASVIILEATHFLENGEAFTKGKYKVTEVFTDGKIHFEAMEKLKLCAEKKTPLDVLDNWVPQEDFTNGVEKAYSDRKKRK